MIGHHRSYLVSCGNISILWILICSLIDTLSTRVSMIDRASIRWMLLPCCSEYDIAPRVQLVFKFIFIYTHYVFRYFYVHFSYCANGKQSDKWDEIRTNNLLTLHCKMPSLRYKQATLATDLTNIQLTIIYWDQGSPFIPIPMPRGDPLKECTPSIKSLISGISAILLPNTTPS
jgi:hypothetical protein